MDDNYTLRPSPVWARQLMKNSWEEVMAMVGWLENIFAPRKSLSITIKGHVTPLLTVHGSTHDDDVRPGDWVIVDERHVISVVSLQNFLMTYTLPPERAITPARYRVKDAEPTDDISLLTVEAMQLLSSESFESLFRWVESHIGTFDPDVVDLKNPGATQGVGIDKFRLSFTILQNGRRLSPETRSWIIRSSNGMFYVCHEKDFEHTYELESYKWEGDKHEE